MKEKEIKEELELGLRCFLEAKERGFKESQDDFEEMQILEAAFNRLFLAVEHFCNALVLFETGNYSPKHFGDWKQLEKFKEKYHLSLAEIYQQTYSLRSYGDYRKFPELEERFNRSCLSEELRVVKELIKKILMLIKTRLEIGYLIEKLL